MRRSPQDLIARATKLARNERYGEARELIEPLRDRIGEDVNSRCYVAAKERNLVRKKTWWRFGESG